MRLAAIKNIVLVDFKNYFLNFFSFLKKLHVRNMLKGLFSLFLFPYAPEILCDIVPFRIGTLK